MTLSHISTRHLLDMIDEAELSIALSELSVEGAIKLKEELRYRAQEEHDRQNYELHDIIHDYINQLDRF